MAHILLPNLLWPIEKYMVLYEVHSVHNNSFKAANCYSCTVLKQLHTFTDKFIIKFQTIALKILKNDIALFIFRKISSNTST